MNTKTVLVSRPSVRLLARAVAILVCVSSPVASFGAAGLLDTWLRKQNDAFSAWEIGGAVRVRGEISDNIDRAVPSRDFHPGLDDSASFLWFHENVRVGYRNGGWQLFAQGQNGHTSGDDNPRRPGEQSFDLYQAYVAYASKGDTPVSVSLGRQEIKIGDQRFIGVPTWGHTGRAFDSVKGKVGLGKTTLEAFTGHPVVYVDGRFDDHDSNDLVSGLVLGSKEWLPKHETQLYVVARNTSAGSSTSVRDIYTFVASLKSLPKAAGEWSWEALVALQRGDITVSGIERDQRAWGVHAQASRSWSKAAGKPSLGIEYNWSSGDRDPNDGRSETLDILFGSNHGKYGIMDLTGWRNTHELHAFGGVKASRSVTVTAHLHGFWMSDTRDFFYPQGGGGRSGNGYGRNAAYGSFLGTEATVEAVWKAREWLDVRGGGGRFFTGRYIDQSKAALGGASDASWYYVQSTFSF
ncbi:hypothetical protein ASA1KI_04450 [Opitutales bacterium ASA1]|uniref:alginate export family protein n=1 Tax=Congregicoccus parvus TaxID=3081749 RepID=UPI002B319ADA|nr:hypothetical protein ASA1KI_04450 [Opitutales bacterium ASA1]